MIIKILRLIYESKTDQEEEKKYLQLCQWLIYGSTQQDSGSSKEKPKSETC